MSRDKCVGELRKIASIMADVEVDVSQLMTLVENFTENVHNTLSETIEDGAKAKTLLELLK